MLGYQIKNTRVQQGLTQYELAEKLGLSSKSTVSMWESGERTPSAAMLPRIAKALGCTIDALFSDCVEQQDDKTGIGQKS